MEFEGAVVKEQGITFAIVVVRPHVLANPQEADQLISSTQSSIFGGIPVVLMAQNSRGAPRFYGRADIVRFLSKVPLSAIPWQRYRLN